MEKKSAGNAQEMKIKKLESRIARLEFELRLAGSLQATLTQELGDLYAVAREVAADEIGYPGDEADERTIRNATPMQAIQAMRKRIEDLGNHVNSLAQSVAERDPISNNTAAIGILGIIQREKMRFAVYSGSEKLDLGEPRISCFCSSKDQAEHMAGFWNGFGYWKEIIL